ncbi:kinase-like domain-containing protein [Haematococcus lacustris]
MQLRPLATRQLRAPPAPPARNTRAVCRAVTTPDAALAYVQATPQLLAHLRCSSREDPTVWHVEELAHGKINHVFLVQCLDPGSSQGAATGLVLKHAPPYVKSAGPCFPLSQDRIHVEQQAMRIMHSHCPNHVPALLHFDPHRHVIAMQWLQPPHDKLLTLLHDGAALPPHLGSQLASLLAAQLLHTSVGTLTPEQHAGQVAAFANPGVEAANLMVVLYEPLDPACLTNRLLKGGPCTPPCTQPHPAELAAQIRGSAEVHGAVAELAESYCSHKQCLIHNDLHTGNLLLSPRDCAPALVCIDWEFATYGPIAFDLGCLVGVLLLAHLVLQQQRKQHQPTHIHRQPKEKEEGEGKEEKEVGQQEQDNGEGAAATGSPAVEEDVARGVDEGGVMEEVLGECPHCCARERQTAWVESTLCLLWVQLLQLVALAPGLTLAPASRGPQGSMDSLVDSSVCGDVAGYAATTLMRLTMGRHAYPGYERLRPGPHLAAAEAQALLLALRLLELRRAWRGVRKGPDGLMEEIVGLVREMHH